MTGQLGVELLKLRTTRLPYGLLAAATGLSALFALLAAARAGGSSVHAVPLPPLSAPSGLTSATTTTGFALLLAATLGVTMTAGEFRHGTATLTYLDCPDRSVVLAAKAAAAALAGVVLGLAAGAAATLTGLAVAAGRGDPLALGAGTLAAHVAGAGLAGALLAAAGAGLGSLLRSQLGAVVAVFAWALVGETLIGGLYTPARPYLPFSAATGLGGTPPGQAAGAFIRTPPGTAPLPFAAGAALVLGAALLLAAVAARVTVPRDVT